MTINSFCWLVRKQGHSNTQCRGRIVALEVPVMSALRRLPRPPVIPSFSFGAFAALVVLALAAVINLATHMQWSDDVATAYFALYGIACLQKYFACREYHCLMNGPGFLVAAVAMIQRDSGVFAHGVGVPYPIFAAAAVLGHALAWRERCRIGSKYQLV
jgi:hypothetical protein